MKLSVKVTIALALGLASGCKARRDHSTLAAYPGNTTAAVASENSRFQFAIAGTPATFPLIQDYKDDNYPFTRQSNYRGPSNPVPYTYPAVPIKNGAIEESTTNHLYYVFKKDQSVCSTPAKCDWDDTHKYCTNIDRLFCYLEPQRSALRKKLMENPQSGILFYDMTAKDYQSMKAANAPIFDSLGMLREATKVLDPIVYIFCKGGGCTPGGATGATVFSMATTKYYHVVNLNAAAQGAFKAWAGENVYAENKPEAQRLLKNFIEPKLYHVTFRNHQDVWMIVDSSQKKALPVSVGMASILRDATSTPVLPSPTAFYDVMYPSPNWYQMYIDQGNFIRPGRDNPDIDPELFTAN